MNIVWYVIGIIVVILLLFLVYKEIIDIRFIVDSLSLIIASVIIKWLGNKVLCRIFSLKIESLWHLLLIFTPVVFILGGTVIFYIIYIIIHYIVRVVFGAIILLVVRTVEYVVCKCEDKFDDLEDFIDELLDTLSDKVEIVLNKFDKIAEIFDKLKDFLDKFADIP